MFGQKKKLAVKKEDMDQAILAKNKSLISNNKKLSDEIKIKKSDIKQAEKELKCIVKDQDNENKILIDLKAKSLEIHDNILKSDSKYKELQSSVKTLNSSVKSLSKSESDLISKIDKLDVGIESKSKKLKEINESIKSHNGLKKKIVSTKDKLDKLLKQTKDADVEYKSLDISLSMKKDEHEEYLSNLAFEKEKYLDQFNDIKSKHDKLLKEFDSKMDELESNQEFVNSQIKGLNHLVEERQNTCIILDKEISDKKDDIKRAEFQAEKIEEEAKAKVSEIKKKYNAWKTNVLAEVAKLQLKNKIDNIDKAGLSEILNG